MTTTEWDSWFSEYLAWAELDHEDEALCPDCGFYASHPRHNLDHVHCGEHDKNGEFIKWLIPFIYH